MRRSQFIQKAKFNFYLYRFEPDEFIELVGENEQSQHALILNQIAQEEYNKIAALQVKKEPECVPEKAKKVSQLEGNLALKFLMNPKELTQLVSNNIKDRKRKNSGDDDKKKEQKQGEKSNPVPPATEQKIEMPVPQKSKKFKYPIKSINEFIQKMLKKELTGILNKVLSQDEIEWAGVRKCFNCFYEKIQEKLSEDEILS